MAMIQLHTSDLIKTRSYTTSAAFCYRPPSQKCTQAITLFYSNVYYGICNHMPRITIPYGSQIRQLTNQIKVGGGLMLVGITVHIR